MLAPPRCRFHASRRVLSGERIRLAPIEQPVLEHVGAIALNACSPCASVSISGQLPSPIREISSPSTRPLTPTAATHPQISGSRSRKLRPNTNNNAAMAQDVLLVPPMKRRLIFRCTTTLLPVAALAICGRTQTLGDSKRPTCHPVDRHPWIPSMCRRGCV